MGNSQQKLLIKDGFFENFNENYQFINEVPESFISQGKIFENSNKKAILIVSRKKIMEENLNNFINNLYIRKDYELNSLIKIKEVILKREQNYFCSQDNNYSEITLFLDFYNHTLEKEIEKREKSQNFFEESELWYIFRTILTFCAFFEKKNLYHGDIQLSQIFLNNKGQVKLFDHSLVNLHKTNYMKKIIFNRYNCILSPEEIKNIISKNINPDYDKIKADAYSLGICLVAAAELNTNYQKVFLKFPDILKNLKQNYTEFLVNCIEKLIRINPSERFSFVEMEKHLEENQEGNPFLDENYQEKNKKKTINFNDALLDPGNYDPSKYSEKKKFCNKSDVLKKSRILLNSQIINNRNISYETSFLQTQVNNALKSSQINMEKASNC